jgi:hypothetical protein
MPSLVVHRVRVYDPQIGTVVVSPRMATEEGAKLMGGQIIPGTNLEIDAALLEGGSWTGLHSQSAKVGSQSVAVLVLPAVVR